MKTVVKAIDLSNAVLKASKAIAAKNVVNPVLESIKIVCRGDSLTLMATDNDISIETTIKCETFIEGDTLVAGKLFADFIKKLEEEDELELNQEEGRLNIKYSSSEGFIQTGDPGAFPEFNKTEEKRDDYFTMSQKDFKELVYKTAFSCIQDDSRPILKGCLIESDGDRITSVALDGFRLALCRKPLKEIHGDIKAVVPARALNEITRLMEDDDGDVTVNIKQRNLKVSINNTTLTARLFEGEFIDYRQIIPTTFLTEFKANRIVFEGAVERAAVLAKSVKNLVRLDIKENYVNITTNSEEGKVDENILINLEGKDLVIAFNSKYILDALRVIEEDFIKVSLNGPISPCIIRPEGNDDCLYLILPIRINN